MKTEEMGVSAADLAEPLYDQEKNTPVSSYLYKILVFLIMFQNGITHVKPYGYKIFMWYENLKYCVKV